MMKKPKTIAAEIAQGKLFGSGGGSPSPAKKVTPPGSFLYSDLPRKLRWRLQKR